MMGVEMKEAFGAWLGDVTLLYASGSPCAIGGHRHVRAPC